MSPEMWSQLGVAFGVIVFFLHRDGRREIEDNKASALREEREVAREKYLSGRLDTIQDEHKRVLETTVIKAADAMNNVAGACNNLADKIEHIPCAKRT